MTERERTLQVRLLAAFRVEAEEHITALSGNLLKLEQGCDGQEIPGLLESSFREVHSLKGAARAVNIASVERVCQALESVFSALKRGTLEVTPSLLDLLMRSSRLLERAKAAAEDPSKPVVPVAPIIAELNAALGGELDSLPPAPQAPAETANAAAAMLSPEGVRIPRADVQRAPVETVRVATGTLDAVRQQAEELLADKAAAADLATDLLELRQSVATWRKQWIRSSFELRSGTSLERVQELAQWNRRFADELEYRVAGLVSAAVQCQRSLAVRVDALAGDSRQLLMLPFSWLLDGMRHVVRDLAADLGKDVAFAVEGDSIEVDRRILSDLKDPLIHILRNCVDHGIEATAERSALGKPGKGSLRIEIAHSQGSQLEIVIADDGAGVNPERVKSSAVKMGILAPEEAAGLSEADAVKLVFRSEVTTSTLITDISGRGLGLAIVQEKLERLGGSVSIESRQGVGTTFRLLVPHSLSAFRGVVVRTSERFFVIPTASVECTMRLCAADIRSVGNRSTMRFGDEAIPVARLRDVLSFPTGAHDPAEGAKLPAVIVKVGSVRVAIIVDEVWQEQEVLVKGLGPHLRGLQGVTGATTLSNGKVAPVLDGGELLRASMRSASPAASNRIGEPPTDRRRPSILVAEDSITSRTLLKSILDAAGYSVETVVDGVDAFAKLRAGEFDLVVSDVDMPRMNGLSLTAKIRADHKLANIPVVLVTSLHSREDQERGMDVGANAYIVKKNFEQSNLLEVVRRLL